MFVKDVMTPEVKAVDAKMMIKHVAGIMRDQEIGALPVTDKNALVGIVTDRDVVVGAVAKGKNPDTTPIRTVMSENIYYCFDHQPFQEAAENMAAKQIRRLPVLNRDMQIVGMLSLGDISKEGGLGVAAEALARISENPSSTDEAG